MRIRKHLPKEEERVLISAWVPKALKEEVKKKVASERGQGRRLSMTDVIEAGFKAYLGK